MTKLKKILRKFLQGIFSPIFREVSDLTDLMIIHNSFNRAQQHPNPFCKYGKKFFSQSDEDGLTLEILKRLELTNGVFAEFGVGDGLENNTLILIADSWRGFWVGGEDLAFKTPSDTTRFHYLQKWITAENIVGFAKEGLNVIKESALDVISLDLDGNDIYMVEALLNADLKPKLFIIEYNAKFPPHIKWKIKYDKNHQWFEGDYFGASLKSFCELFEKHGYVLICCNSHTGANAFFVKEIYADKFPEVPAEIEKIYAERVYYPYRNFGHSRSPKTVESLFLQDR
jgi:hypothetical protein